jgi:hypothetical protein
VLPVLLRVLGKELGLAFEVRDKLVWGHQPEEDRSQQRLDAEAVVDLVLGQPSANVAPASRTSEPA